MRKEIIMTNDDEKSSRSNHLPELKDEPLSAEVVAGLQKPAAMLPITDIPEHAKDVIRKFGCEP